MLRKTSRFFLLMALSATSSIAIAKEYLLVNANIIVPHNQTELHDGWVHIVDDKIKGVGHGQLPQVKDRIDVQGAFIMPGMIDSHLHLTAGPMTVSVVENQPHISMKSKPEVTRFHAMAALSSGITSAFSPAGDPIANQHYVQMQQAGEWLGPSLKYAGLTFDPTPIEGGSVYPSTPQEWQQEIQRQKSLGVSYIKLYQGLSVQEVNLGVSLAHEAGLKAIAHLDKVSWQEAVDAGIDALTHALPTSADLLPEDARDDFLASLAPMSAKHLYQWFEWVNFDAPPMQKLITDLATKDVSVDLTLVVNEMMYFYPEIDSLYPDERWYHHPEVAANWKTNLGASLYDWTDEDFERAQSSYSQVETFLLRLHEANVPLLIGSDSYSGGPVFWRELALHQRAGIENWEILQLITNKAASRLALTKKGKIAAGYQADLVVMTDNPLKDIGAVKTITQVIQNGNRFDIGKLRHRLSDQTSEFASNSLQ
ncbi:amidohydrolase family protein [Alteromonas antoniana]|uniref:amidohydrolase family protein n=1 Tax=Alteromonas antoniana TaxID=2803813 RepID=UPI001C46A07E|nr:amidohydrolase family protein [Alteromonas antoniana]